MNGLERALREIAAELNERSQPYAVVGGLAISARSEPRLTRDIDLAVAVPNDLAAEALIRSLGTAGYRSTMVTEQEDVGRLATARLEASTTEPYVTDLLFASSGIEPEIASSADRIAVFPGVEVPVASVGHLMALKLLARDDRRRPTDADDLRALVEVAVEQDWWTAEEAVAAISIRGYDRGRDLSAALAALRADRAG